MMEPIDGGYRPSCVVNMTLRFDEALQVATSSDELERAIRSGEIGRLTIAEREAASQETYTGQKRRALPNRGQTPRWIVRTPDGGALGLGDPTRDARAAQVTKDPRVTDSWVRSGAQDALRPLTFASDGFTTAMNLVPRRGTFDMPHPRLAATFTMTFDFTDIPIDPRLPRAMGVEIHIGCVSARDYGDGMVGVDSEGRRRSRLATRSRLIDPRTGLPAVADSTLLFYGTVDDWDFDWDKQSGTTVTLVGRSIIGILLDGKPPADALQKIDLTRPIHRVIADLISTIPIDQRLTLDVFTDAAEWEGGVVPAPGSIEGFTKVRISAESGKPTSGAGGSEKVNYWDLITNLCNSVGGVPHMQGNILWIRPGRSIFDIYSRPGRTPFATDREAPDGRLAVRRLVVQRDLKRFKLSRKFGGTPVPVVRAYGRDDRQAGAARVVHGQWPPVGSPAAAAKGDDEITRIDFPNIRDKDRLTQIARDVYEEVGRGEIGGEFESARLASFGGDNADPDMLRLRSLEPVEIVTDATQGGASPLTAELNRRAAMTFDEEVQELEGRLGDRDAARAIVAASRGSVVGVLDTFRVTAMRFEIDASTGIVVSGQFQNYIVARHGQSEEIAKENSRVIGARADAPGADRKRKVKKPGKKPRATGNWLSRLREQAANDPAYFHYQVRERQRQEQAIRAQQRLNPAPNSFGGSNGRMRI
jgi:hypothetical protein